MQTVTYKCPNCNAGIKYNPKKQLFLCEFCDSTFTEEEVTAFNPVSQNAYQDPYAEIDTSESASHEDAGAVYTCPSCGAEIVTEATTAATYCFYCHNPITLTGRLEGKYLPSKIIPFKISKEEALDIFRNWVKKKKYVPDNFFSKDQINKFTGVYFPYWMTDFDISGKITGKGTVSSSYTQGSYRYTTTSSYDVMRDGSVHLEDITHNALSKANQKLADGVQPYSEEDIRPFNITYLSGFQAEKRDIEREDIEETVRNEAIGYTRNLLLQNGEMQFSSVSDENFTHTIDNENWDYTLMPVWTITYKGKDNNMYYYSINGQTGKTCGELPVDKGKLRGLFFKVAIPVMAILVFLGWLF